MKIKKRDKFLYGGIIIAILINLSRYNEQGFDIAELIGSIVMGGIVGYIGYLIFGRKKQAKK